MGPCRFGRPQSTENHRPRLVFALGDSLWKGCRDRSEHLEIALQFLHGT
jgi:hypothetical protein